MTKGKSASPPKGLLDTPAKRTRSSAASIASRISLGKIRRQASVLAAKVMAASMTSPASRGSAPTFGPNPPLTQILVDSVDYRKHIGFERFELRRRALKEAKEEEEKDSEKKVANKKTN